MSRNELPDSGDWEAVREAVYNQMKRLDMSVARLSRESGVSETTIRYIGRSEKRQRSTLVALSAALGWEHDYLVDVLRGAAGADAPRRASSDPSAVKRVLRAELDPVNEKIDRMGETLYAIVGKMDVLLTRKQAG